MSMLDTPKTPENDFEESVKSDSCVKILLNCLRNSEKEVKHIHKLVISNNSQIRGEKQSVSVNQQIWWVWKGEARTDKGDWRTKRWSFFFDWKT